MAGRLSGLCIMAYKTLLRPPYAFKTLVFSVSLRLLPLLDCA